MINADAVYELLSYNPETGFFCWHKTGCRAGHTRKDGYVGIGIGGRIYRAHRLAWLLVYDRMPTLIDHINGDRSDNRIANLRECTSSENRQNSRHVRSASGYRGVSRNGRRWRAAIALQGVDYYLGTFATPEEAHAAYCDAAAERHAVNPFATA